MITPQNLIINKHIGHIYIYSIYIYTHHIYHLYHSNHLSISIKFFGFSSLPEKRRISDCNSWQPEVLLFGSCIPSKTNDFINLLVNLWYLNTLW